MLLPGMDTPQHVARSLVDALVDGLDDYITDAHRDLDRAATLRAAVELLTAEVHAPAAPPSPGGAASSRPGCRAPGVPSET